MRNNEGKTMQPQIPPASNQSTNEEVLTVQGVQIIKDHNSGRYRPANVAHPMWCESLAQAVDLAKRLGDAFDVQRRYKHTR